MPHSHTHDRANQEAKACWGIRWTVQHCRKNRWRSARYFHHFFVVLEARRSPVTDAQLRTWKSDVYRHFKKPTIIKDEKVVKYKFTCKTWVHFLTTVIFLFYFSIEILHNLLPVHGTMIPPAILYGTLRSVMESRPLMSKPSRNLLVGQLMTRHIFDTLLLVGLPNAIVPSL